MVAWSKRQLNKFCIINHLSWPLGLSVNNGIYDAEASIVYDSFKKAVNDYHASGLGTHLAKLDLRDTFRHILLHVADWPLFGFVWL